MPRPYTAEEEREVERLCRRGVTGGHVDMSRAYALMKINPKRYGEIHRRIKQEEIDKIKMT